MAPPAPTEFSRKLDDPRLMLALLCVVYAIIGFAKGHEFKTIDFAVFYRTGERFLAGTSLYPGDDLSFKYSPTVAPVFSLLTLFNKQVAGILWGLLIAAATFDVGRRVLQWVPGVSGVTLLISFAALSMSFFFEQSMGQTNLMMLWLLMVSHEALERRQPMRAGGLWALAVLLKPPALFTLLWLHRSQWQPRMRFILGAVLTVGGLGSALLFRYGFDAALTEFALQRADLDRTTLEWFMGHNPQGLLQVIYTTLQLSPPQSMRDFLPLTAGLTVLVALAAMTSADQRFRTALLLAGVAVLSPLCWRQNFVLTWPLWVLMLHESTGWRRTAAWVLCALSIANNLYVHDGEMEPWVVSYLLYRPYGWLALALMVLTFLQSRVRPAAITASATVTH